jgi:hypothetical protein
VHGVGRAFCGHVTFRRLQALTGGGGRALLMEGVCVGGSLVEGVSLKNRVPENGMFGMSASSGRAPEAPANSLGLGATNSTYYETYSAYDAFVARSFMNKRIERLGELYIVYFRIKIIMYMNLVEICSPRCHFHLVGVKVGLV